MTLRASWTPDQPSHLFYQSHQRRPLLDRAEGIYLWDVNGKRYLDGSSGAMVSNIGHSNPRVLEAMRKQMDERHLRLSPAFRKRACRTAGRPAGGAGARRP